MKFLYCPECKELRVKSWYSMREICSRCRGPARAITVPRAPMTYVQYGLYLVVAVLVGIHLLTDVDLFLWLSVASLISLMAVSYFEITRGERYARAKIRMTSSDLGEFRRKGWA